MAGKVVLGKGLGALIPQGGTSKPATSDAPDSGEKVEQIALKEIVPSPLQPRKQFRPDQLQELIDSIREHGIIQPLIARRVQGKCELIAGERRWRAASQLGLPQAPVIIRHASDRDVLELALIENLQREDLNPMEEAHAYRRLAEEFSLRQEDIAVRVGKSRSVVANSVRLLELHPQVQSYLAQGRISVGHAKVVLTLENKEEQLWVTEIAIRQAATVRATEKLVADHLAKQGMTKSGRTGARPQASTQRPEVRNAISQIESRFREKLATHVTISHNEKKGRIEIEYYGTDDLERILATLGLNE